ncbi:MAG: hypothetical protein R3C16_13670 [Hyphomonadaceae bacterium]
MRLGPMGSTHEDRTSLPQAPRNSAALQRAVPRWIVVTGLVVYCSACWALLWVAGSAGVDMVRTAFASP